MSTEDIIRDVFEGGGGAIRPTPTTGEERFVDGVLRATSGTPTPTVPTDIPQAKQARLAQETDTAIGPPSTGLSLSRGVGALAETNPPKTPNEAINAWTKKNVDLRPTPNFAKQVDARADAWTMDLLIQTGMFARGKFNERLDDELIEKIRGGFMYVAAGTIGDVTPDDAADALGLAMESYGNQVITRSRAKTQEIIANHSVGGVAAVATRQTLTPEGRRLVEEQDKITNAAMQLLSRRDEEAVQGAFKSLLIASNAKMRAETGADPEVVERLRLEGNALAATKPVAQDQLRFALSIQEDPSLSERGPLTRLFSADQITGPGRLMARTTEVFKDIEDPILAHRQVVQHFQSQINRARAQRIGANPDANHVGMLYHQFPGIAIELADRQLQAQVVKEVEAETFSRPGAFERKLQLARRRRLEPLVENLFAMTQNLDEELQRVEARESISFITDLETATKRGVGNIFEALGEAGTAMRKAFLQKTGEQRVVRRNLAVAMSGEAAMEAMREAQDVAEEWEAQRTILQAQPGELRFSPGATMGANPVPGRVHPSVPPAVIPLEKDFSNLRAVLISAERAGEMPYSLRKMLFSDDPNDMVANAAVMASDVMAPSTILRMINNGLSLTEVRTAFKEAQRVAFEEKVLPSTPGPDILVGVSNLQEITDKEQALIRSLSKLSPFERATEGLGLTIALAQTRFERGWKELALGFVDEPRQVFDTLAGATPFLVGGGVALTPVTSRVRQAMVNAGLHNRLRKALADTARFDPQAVHQGRKQIAQVLDRVAEPGGEIPAKIGKRQELYRATASLMEQIDNEHSRGTIGAALEGKAPDAKRLNASARQFKRTLRQLGLDELKHLSDGMGLPLQALAQTQAPGGLTLEAIGRLGERFAETFNLDGLSMRPWTKLNQQKLAGRITDSLAKGAAPDWETMPISLDAAKTDPDIFQRLDLESIRPGSRRVTDASGKYANTIMTWAMRRAEDTLGVRHLQARQRGNQVDFIEFMERKYEGELHDLELAAPSRVLQRKEATGQPLDSEELLIVQAKDKLHERMRRTRRLKQTVDQREWDTPVNMDREDIVTDATDADLILWARNQAEAGNAQAFWKNNRRVGETFENFQGRLNRIMAGIPRPDDNIAGLRSAIARRYLNAPGLSTKQRFDTASGAALTPQAAKQLRGARRSVKTARQRYEELREEIENFTPESDADRRRLSGLKRKLREAHRRARFDDPDFHEEVLGADLGIRKEDLRTDYKEIVELSRVENTTDALSTLERTQDITDGRIASELQLVRQSQFDLLFNQRADAFQIDLFAKRFFNLAPEKQRLFNEVLSKSADTGDMRALRKLADRDEKIAGLITELDADNNLKVRQLLDETNHFRQNLLHMWRNSGGLRDAEFDTLVGGYAPHLYRAGEHRTLLGAQFDQDIFGASTKEGGLDLSEMLRQKHHKMWKASVSVRGGRALTHLFDTQDEAMKFIETEYGLQKSFKKAGPGVLESRTKLDDPVALLEPLGEERAAALGFLGEGPSLFKRLDTLVRDITRDTILRSMNRPGWTMTDKQYKAAIAGADADRITNSFEQLADTRQNGALRGKWVHRGVAQLIDDINGGMEKTSWIGDTMRKFAEENGVVSKALVGAGFALTGTARKLKQAIVTNKIARSIQTTFFNFLMDSEMFGVAAAGRDFSILHPRAIRNKLRAKRDLFAILEGREPSPEFIDAVRRGVIDDTLISHTIDPNLLKTLRTGLLQRVNGMTHIKNDTIKAVQGLIGRDTTISKALDRFVGDDPEVISLRRRWDEIDLAERQGILDPGDATSVRDEKLAIEALLKKAAPTRGNALRRTWRGINQILIGDGKTGLFNDTETLSREVYGRVSNINRLGAYYHMLDKGLSPDEAVRRLNRFMQNYSRVPQALRRIGQSPFGSPVIAFPYEQMRIAYNTMKYHPGLFAGFMGGFSATNFMSMVAGGLDPFRVYEGVQSDSAGFPGFLALASSLVLPHKDGTFSTLQIPALNWYQTAREPFGVQSKIFGLDDTPLLTLSGVVKNVISKFLLGNPLTTTIYAGVQSRDPKTGQVLPEMSHFWGRAASELGELFVPPEIPFVGSSSRDIAEGIEKPRYVRNGREISVSQRFIQSVMGVRLRGWLGTDGVSSALGEAGAKLLGVEAWSDLPVRAKELRGFDDRDVLSHLYVSSRELDPDNARTERILDKPFTKLRKARDLLESDDPAEKAEGRRLRDEGLQEFEDELRPFADFHGRELQQARTEQEKDQLLARAFRTQNFESQFDRLSVSRKAGILVGAAMTGVNSETIKDLWLRTMAQDTGELRAYSSTASIQRALSLLNSHLENPPTRRLTTELTELRDWLVDVEQQARFDHEIQQETDVMMRNASDLFFERNK